MHSHDRRPWTDVYPSAYLTGDEARALREFLNWSAAEVAKHMDVNESTVYRYEWRECDPVPPMYALALRRLLAAARHPEDVERGDALIKEAVAQFGNDKQG
jgi:DNA-binding transcriptional regulator YiaG